MAVRIEEVFQVAAPPDQVWAYLTDPRQVAPCLPGANLTDVIDEKTYAGTIKVKVGPVTAGYRGKIQITDQDDESRTVKMLGEGMESSGAGSAKMVLESRVVALDDGSTEVRVQQDVEVVGKLAQFGRGMVQEVGKQLFRQFVGCAKAHLEAAAGVASPPGDTPGDAEAADTTAAADDAAPWASDGAAPDAPAVGPNTGSEAGSGASTAERDADAAPSAAPGVDPAPPLPPDPAPPPDSASLPAPQPDGEAIGGIGLVLKALWALLTRPFRRS